MVSLTIEDITGNRRIAPAPMNALAMTSAPLRSDFGGTNLTVAMYLIISATLDVDMMKQWDGLAVGQGTRSESSFKVSHTKVLKGYRSSHLSLFPNG